MSALTEKVAREHVRQDSYAGNGHTEPRESWTSCSCGAHIWAWQQFYEETDEDPDENWTQHIAYVTEAAVRAAVAAEIRVERTQVPTDDVAGHLEAAALGLAARIAEGKQL